MIYLYHKEHGTHIAYSEDEVTRLKKNGWSTEKPGTLHLPKKDRKNGTHRPAK